MSSNDSSSIFEIKYDCHMFSKVKYTNKDISTLQICFTIITVFAVVDTIVFHWNLFGVLNKVFTIFIVIVIIQECYS